MRLNRTITITLALALLTGGAAIAQRAAGTPERWDDDDLVTLDGTITEVDRPLATFEAGGDTYAVHLGPIWYWEARGYGLDRGDRVTIKGQVSRYGLNAHLYPHTIERGKETYVLADDEGVPLWSRAHYGPGPRAGAWGGGPWHRRHGWAHGDRGWRGAGCRCGCRCGGR